MENLLNLVATCDYMNASQIENQIASDTKGLPIEILQEILDFIQFLTIKKRNPAPDSIQSDLTNLELSEFQHLEEEFVDYKSAYPVE
jgi:hypothetical protein